MAKLTKKVIVKQDILDAEGYFVERLFNVTGFTIGQRLTRARLDNLIQAGIAVEIR